MKLKLFLLFSLVFASLFAETPVELMNRKFYILTWRGHQEKPAENQLYSPFSMQQAAGMLSLGAAGSTKTQIDQVFGFDQNSWKWFASHHGMSPAGKQTSFFNANFILADRYLKYDQKYSESVGKYFDGRLLLADFNRGDLLFALLNRMVSVGSNGLLKDVFSEQDFAPEMIMLVVNVLSFKAPWQHEFEKSQTKEMPFLSADGKKKNVPMMHQKEMFPYFHDAARKIHGVVLPYKDSRFEMIVLIPTKPEVKVSVIPQALSEGALPKWLKAVSSKKNVDLYLPKFKLSSKMNLSDLLQKCGMRDAFLLTKSDFSHLGDEELCVDKILQVAQIEVDETGTEAASGTAASVMPEAAGATGTHYFRVDRPFCFILRYKPTDAVLFMGIVNQLP